MVWPWSIVARRAETLVVLLVVVAVQGEPAVAEARLAGELDRHTDEAAADVARNGLLPYLGSSTFTSSTLSKVGVGDLRAAVHLRGVRVGVDRRGCVVARVAAALRRPAPWFVLRAAYFGPR
jgi:hypothetical protein